MKSDTDKEFIFALNFIAMVMAFIITLVVLTGTKP